MNESLRPDELTKGTVIIVEDSKERPSITCTVMGVEKAGRYYLVSTEELEFPLAVESNQTVVLGEA
ncbi:hypothetical protein OG897_08430 [Streptomyces sp. NBC_00237]|uniref:hypothetical protein n=1 Tax=Streptomyces sp. NBC_00237 TaxID=2975687 RepID=UPI00225C0780|nr:hypothetical protein [Streptomyces sp. NBC_00237]MCX5201477.1 hypothetical protein [Streptomyces sp. NBC_00237]